MFKPISIRRACVLATAVLGMCAASAQADTGPSCNASTSNGAASCAVTYTCAQSTCTVFGSVRGSTGLLSLRFSGSVTVTGPAGASSGSCAKSLGTSCAADSAGAVSLRHGETAQVACSATPLLGLGGAKVSCSSTVTGAWDVTLRAQLRAVAPSTSPGTGEATLDLDPPSGAVCWHVTARNLLGASTRVYIHQATLGPNGPVVRTTDLSGDFDHCTVIESPQVAQDMAANPGGYYLSLHTTTHPGGEIRGPLSR